MMLPRLHAQGRLLVCLLLMKFSYLHFVTLTNLFIFNLLVRKRMTRARKEPLFQDVERQWSPQKLSNQRVKRKPRAKWTEDEEKTVYKAVQKYGLSSWADIVKTNVLPGRSNVDIKDKWRTMVKTGRDKELKDEFKSGLDSSSEEN